MSATVFSLIRYLAACPLSTRETVETEKPVRCAMLMRVSFRHRRVYFETKLEKICEKQGRDFVFYFSFLLLQNLHKRLR